MSQKQHEGSDTPGCSMCQCKAQDSVIYAIPVLTDDIRARRGEDIFCEDEEYSKFKNVRIHPGLSAEGVGRGGGQHPAMRSH